MPLKPDRSRIWSHCIGRPRSILLPLPRTSRVAPSFSAHSTACRSSAGERGLIVPAIVSEPRDVRKRDLVVVHRHTAELRAAPELGEHLAGIELIVGIEGALHAHLRVEI